MQIFLRPSATALLALALAACSASCTTQKQTAVDPSPQGVHAIEWRAPQPPQANHLTFSVRYQGIESSLSTLPAFVLPRQTLTVEVVGGTGPFQAEASGGRLLAMGPTIWNWSAPHTVGDQQIRIRDLAAPGGATLRLQVFVMQPYNGEVRLGNQRIGRYVADAKESDPAYVRPQGFIEVTAANFDRPLTPHFRLGQFLCKDVDSYPKYLALRPPMLLKLEMLIDELAKRGFPAETLHIMSGFRTPAYNATIGNETSLSRHLYGDGADVFLDRDGDTMQDDVNHDGRSTRDDARVLFEIVETSLDPKLPENMQGGLAAYGSTSAHGPFVHIDTRGKRARW